MGIELAFMRNLLVKWQFFNWDTWSPLCYWGNGGFLKNQINRIGNFCHFMRDLLIIRVSNWILGYFFNFLGGTFWPLDSELDSNWKNGNFWVIFCHLFQLLDLCLNYCIFFNKFLQILMIFNDFSQNFNDFY